MQVNKIVFPTDFSHTGDAALAMASSLARDFKATLLIVHVEEPPTAYGGGDFYYGIPDPATEELKKMLEGVVPTSPDVNYEQHLITGEPASALVRFAESENADVIIMGTHGRNGLSRLLMGSVAEAVVRKSEIPVLTYREPAKKE